MTERVINFMECPHAAADWNYCFDGVEARRTTQIPLPIARDLMTIEPKIPGTILLDHRWPDPLPAGRDWSDRLWNFFAEHTGRYVAALDRCDSPLPEFIQRIPCQRYEDYLAATARFERFIVTHHGSYNHSAVDMGLRGTQVIVPETPDGPFIPSGNIGLLNAAVIHSSADLLAVLGKPVEAGSLLHRSTDLKTVAEMIVRDSE